MVWSAPSGEVLIDIVSRPGQTEHGHGALAYGGKQAGVAPARPAAPYAPPYPPAQLRVHQPGYGSAALSYRDSYSRGGGGAVGEYRAGARMSLLGSAYLPPPAPAHHPDPPPFKKIRLSAERPATHQPLRVDTREPVMNTYNNSVEVLSPNPPSEPTVEDQSFRTTKDDLLQQISKVDREMALSEQTLLKLKKKQEELEQSASKPARAEEPEEAPPRHRSLAQCIYADNRKRAASAHAVLSHLGPSVSYPLYNQPQDTQVYHDNIRRHRSFRKRLADHLRKIRLETEKREDALTEEYSRRAADWLRRVERLEMGQKRKAKDARNREFFEKVFPELRKQREERERFNRLGARVKSEAELEEIADGLHEQEHEDKKMRSLTVVPPLLRTRDHHHHHHHHLDTNKRCMDMEAEHKGLQLRNVWTQAERELFREKYLQHPKNFGQIASFLPRKSVRDCVRFYYLSKKAENYKQLLRKPRPRRHARPRPAPEPELPAGVTTRLQRSQGSRGAEKESCLEEMAEPVNCIPVPPAAPATARAEMARTPPLPPSPPPASSAPPAPVTNNTSSSNPAGVTCSSSVSSSSSSCITSSSTITVTSPQSTSGVSVATVSVSSTVTVASNVSVSGTPSPASQPSSSQPSTETPPAQPAQPELPTATVTTSTTTVITTTAVSSGASVSCATGVMVSGVTLTVVSGPPGGSSAPTITQTTSSATSTATDTAASEANSTPSSTIASTTATLTPVSSTCTVCSVAAATRAVAPSQASQYGLDPSVVGARVCEGCHCRCVRARRSRCTVPSCAGPRVKRLRHLPPRWHDLPQDLKRPIMDEFQIPSDLSKCCLTCFKRITRRLDTIGEGGSAPEPTEDEAARFRALLREHGTAWERMATASGRTPASLKAFYFTYRKKLQLDTLISERNPTRGSDTDDSILSSGDTDTASAESPRPPPLPGPRTDAVAPRRHRRDEYDSSATETADEENDAPSTKTVNAVSVTTGVTTVPPGVTVTGVSGTTSGAGVTGVSGVSAAGAGSNGSGPLTVRDVVLNMIEVSLMKNSRPPPLPHTHSMHQAPKVNVSSGHESLATLTVVSGAGHEHSPRSPQRATITPLADKDLMVLHIEPRAPESLLDLSVKRPRHDPPKPQQAHRNTEYSPYRAQERESPTQYNSKPKPVASPRQTLKLPTNPKGSITLGTPVESRFETQRMQSDPKTGSITAGTPVHAPHHLPEKRNFDYYKRRSPGGAYAYSAAPNQPRPQSPSFSNPSTGAVSRGPYGHERRQIMLTDFITSQQMHGGARRSEQPHAQHGQHAQHAQHGQLVHRRDRDSVSVIQRHTHTYSHPPPGHEAFTSLVNAASAAPALPVPRREEPASPPVHHQPHLQHHQHQQHHQQHEQIRGPREFAMAQKYAQYSTDRRAPPRDSRERMVPIQERHYVIEQHNPHNPHGQHNQQQQQQQHHQHQQQQQQMMIDRHHLNHGQQNVSSSEERRSSSGNYNTTNKRQIHPMERKECRPTVSVTSVPIMSTVVSTPTSVCVSSGVGAGVGVSAGVGTGGASADRARPGDGTLTAASLINAIITHQINQSSDQRFPPKIIRENETSQQPELPRDLPRDMPRELPRELSRDMPRDGEREEPPGHTTSIKLGDLASNIIVRDFSSPNTTSLMHHNTNNRFAVSSADSYTSGGAGGGAAAGGGQAEEWRREAPKHAPYLEPVSPPDNHHSGRSSAGGGTGAGAGGRRYSAVGVGVGGGVLTAYDYVKTRIVEVMRSDSDERAKPLTFPTAYAYPYSALNVATPTAPPPAQASAQLDPPAVAVSVGGGQPEPAPLMSAQYEPLSDED
ncbi:uncharacterized protein LOC116777108 isoform X2 [Danaus plexippus]|uniref:uncharacterized protein LOC116777108 isoform X2 n=1 Tax=Danaus plexippus TaxID=13037 RepID=UPI002AB02975|nr:uncharacterized protein LOC116777108 isoform X2 [Danaus plexippus]